MPEQDVTRDQRYQAALLLDRLGLSTESLGPPEEWSPAPRPVYQKRHDTFWRVVCDLMPDDEDDEPHWMTEDASAELKANN